MHHRNLLQKLVIEIYKVANGLRPKIMNEVFQFQTQNRHNLRNISFFRIASQSSEGKKVYPTVAKKYGAKNQTK